MIEAVENHMPRSDRHRRDRHRAGSDGRAHDRRARRAADRHRPRQHARKPDDEPDAVRPDRRHPVGHALRRGGAPARHPEVDPGAQGAADLRRDGRDRQPGRSRRPPRRRRDGRRDPARQRSRGRSCAARRRWRSQHQSTDDRAAIRAATASARNGQPASASRHRRYLDAPSRSVLDARRRGSEPECRGDRLPARSIR